MHGPINVKLQMALSVFAANLNRMPRGCSCLLAGKYSNTCDYILSISNFRCQGAARTNNLFRIFFFVALLHFKFRITQNTILLLRASFCVAVNLYFNRYLLLRVLERTTGTYPESLIPATHPHTLFPLTLRRLISYIYIWSTHS